jgi:hypothetical protein
MLISQNDLKTLLYLLLHSGLPGKELIRQLTEFTYLTLTQEFEVCDPEALKKLIRNDLIALLYLIAINQVQTHPEEKFATYLRNRLTRITRNALQQGLVESPIYLGGLNTKEDMQERFLFHQKEQKEAENGRKTKKRSFVQRKTLKRERKLAKIDHFFPGVLLKREESHPTQLKQLNLL